MVDSLDIVDRAIGSFKTLRTTIARSHAERISAVDERDLIKATAFAWIRNQRPRFGHSAVPPRLEEIDQLIGEMLEFSDRRVVRTRCKKHLKAIIDELVTFRSEIFANPTQFQSNQSSRSTPPDWTKLVPDQDMQNILTRRWQETALCIDAGAHLAATVMMGAMLEALLLSRANRVSDKSTLFKAKLCPKDKSNKSLPLQNWKLKNLIDVAHELGWIRQSAKDVSVVLRDYRNYIHPAKELSHKVRIEKEDSEMFWLVFRSLSDQITNSIKK